MSQSLEKNRGKLFGLLKEQWAVIKDRSADDSAKTVAKTRINELQAELKVDVTDFSVPYVKGETQTKTTSVSATTVTSKTATNIVANGKEILQEFIDVAFPIAMAKAKEQLGEDTPTGQLLIMTEALLKPMGTVFGSLIKK